VFREMMILKGSKKRAVLRGDVNLSDGDGRVMNGGGIRGT